MLFFFEHSDSTNSESEALHAVIITVICLVVAAIVYDMAVRYLPHLRKMSAARTTATTAAAAAANRKRQHHQEEALAMTPY